MTFYVKYSILILIFVGTAKYNKCTILKKSSKLGGSDMKKNEMKRKKISGSYMLCMGAAVAGEIVTENCTVAGVMCICAVLALFESVRYEKYGDEEADKEFTSFCRIYIGWMWAIIGIYVVRFSF